MFEIIDQSSAGRRSHQGHRRRRLRRQRRRAHDRARDSSGVEFICANTDAQALKRSTARTQLQLGSGADARARARARGRRSAATRRWRTATASPRRSTAPTCCSSPRAWAAAPAPARRRSIADIAKSTRHPDRRRRHAAVQVRGQAAEGRRRPASRNSAKSVDSLIIIPNDKLMQVLGEDVSVLDAYAAANDVLHGAVSGIAEVINNPGLVNVDFADVRTVMGEVGMAMMGSATASGRGSRAARPRSARCRARCSRTSTWPVRAACWSTSRRRRASR